MQKVLFPDGDLDRNQNVINCFFLVPPKPPIIFKKLKKYIFFFFFNEMTSKQKWTEEPGGNNDQQFFLTFSRYFCFNSFSIVKLRDKRLSVGGNGEYLDARTQMTPLEASSPPGFQQHPTLGPDECSN